MKQLNSKQKKFAQLSGISILFMAILAGLTMGIFFESSLRMSAAELQEHVLNNIQTAQFAVLCWVGIWITDVLATWGFYWLYRELQVVMASLTAGLRLIYSLILGMAILQLWPLTQVPETDADTLYSSLHAFEHWWSIGLFIFGFHLIGLGVLNRQLGIRKIWIPSFLLLGGIGYILIHGGSMFMPNFEAYKSGLEQVLLAPMILGEVGLALLLTLRPTYLSRSFAQPTSDPT